MAPNCEAVIHPKGETTEEIDVNMAAAGARPLEYFNGSLAEERSRIDRDDDVIAQLLRAEVAGEPLAESDLINTLFLLMFAGLDTVTASLSCLIAWLGRHPEQRQALVDSPDLLVPAIGELMRFESPVPSGMRYAQRAIVLEKWSPALRPDAVRPAMLWMFGVGCADVHTSVHMLTTRCVVLRPGGTARTGWPAAVRAGRGPHGRRTRPGRCW